MTNTLAVMSVLVITAHTQKRPRIFYGSCKQLVAVPKETNQKPETTDNVG